MSEYICKIASLEEMTISGITRLPMRAMSEKTGLSGKRVV